MLEFIDLHCVSYLLLVALHSLWSLNPLLTEDDTRRVGTPVWHRGVPLCTPPRNISVPRVSKRLGRGELAIKAQDVTMNPSEEWLTVKKDVAILSTRWATIPCREKCDLFWSVFHPRSLPRAFIHRVLINVSVLVCDICEVPFRTESEDVIGMRSFAAIVRRSC